MSDSLRSHGLYTPWNSPGQNTGVGSLSLLQGIFPTQGSNPGLLHCRRILLPAEPQPYYFIFNVFILYMCVCVCVYIYTHAYIHTHTYIYIHTKFSSLCHFLSLSTSLFHYLLCLNSLKSLFVYAHVLKH